MHYLSLVLKGISLFIKPSLSYFCSFTFNILLTRITVEILSCGNIATTVNQERNMSCHMIMLLDILSKPFILS